MFDFRSSYSTITGESFFSVFWMISAGMCTEYCLSEYLKSYYWAAITKPLQGNRFTTPGTDPQTHCVENEMYVCLDGCQDLWLYFCHNPLALCERVCIYVCVCVYMREGAYVLLCCSTPHASLLLATLSQNFLFFFSTHLYIYTLIMFIWAFSFVLITQHPIRTHQHSHNNIVCFCVTFYCLPPLWDQTTRGRCQSDYNSQRVAGWQLVKWIQKHNLGANLHAKRLRRNIL